MTSKCIHYIYMGVAITLRCMAENINTGMLRREYLQKAGAVGTAAMSAGLAGCMGSENADELIVGIWGGSWQELMEEAVIDPYEEDTDVSVDYVVGNDTDRFNRLIAQRDEPPVDVSQQDGAGLVRGQREDLWLELDEELVPRIADVPDQFKTDYWALQIFAASALQYNTDAFDSEPDSWDIFLDSEHHGRVGLYTQDPTHDLLAFALHQTDGEDPTAIDQAFEMYEEVVAEMDPVFITSSDEYGNRWVNDELDVGRYWSARAASWSEEGAPVSFAIPDTGAMTTNFGNAIPNNIPEERIEAAGEFIDYTLRDDAARLVAEQMYYTNPIDDIEYPDDVVDDLIQPEDLDNLQVPPFDFIAENRSDWRQRMQEIIDDYN